MFAISLILLLGSASGCNLTDGGIERTSGGNNLDSQIEANVSTLNEDDTNQDKDDAQNKHDIPAGGNVYTTETIDNTQEDIESPSETINEQSSDELPTVDDLNNTQEVIDNTVIIEEPTAEELAETGSWKDVISASGMMKIFDIDYREMYEESCEYTDYTKENIDKEFDATEKGLLTYNKDYDIKYSKELKADYIKWRTVRFAGWTDGYTSEALNIRLSGNEVYINESTIGRLTPYETDYGYTVNLKYASKYKKMAIGTGDAAGWTLINIGDSDENYHIVWVQDKYLSSENPVQTQHVNTQTTNNSQNTNSNSINTSNNENTSNNSNSNTPQNNQSQNTDNQTSNSGLPSGYPPDWTEEDIQRYEKEKNAKLIAAVDPNSTWDDGVH